MSTLTIAEAASVLGVTSATLRNWDKAGKLRSRRHPVNNYRIYDLGDVQKLIPPTFRVEEERIAGDDGGDREIKRSLVRVHKALRDTDGNSSIVERFDEMTKLLFLKLTSSDNTAPPTFDRLPLEPTKEHANRIRRHFADVSRGTGLFPPRFAQLNLSDSAIAEVSAILARMPTSKRTDIKGHAYEEVIRNTFEKGDHQQFFTPPGVVSFLVQLMGDRLSGAVCDPACGTGGFLVEAAKTAPVGASQTGLEIDERLAWVAGINLLAHGATNFRCLHLPGSGALSVNAQKYAQQFDAIITNPPFGSDFGDSESLATFQLGRGRTSRRRGVLFIERCLDMLKEGGFLGIVIDEGVLSLSSAEDVRALLLSRAEVQAVISLPETTFMPYASVATSILLLRRTDSPSPKKLTFFSRAERVGRKANGEPDIEYDDNGQAALASDLPRILQDWTVFESTGTLTQRTEETYLSNLLSIRGDQAEGNRLDFMFHHPSRLAAKQGLDNSKFKLLTLGELCAIRNDAAVPSVDMSDQLIPYTGLAHIEPRVGQAHQVITPANSLKSTVKRYYRGDILFAKMRPNLRKVAHISFDRPGYASAECVVLTVKCDGEGTPMIDPFLLSVLLRSDYVFGQIIHLIAGIGRPRIAAKDLLAVRVPVPPHANQSAILQAFAATKSAYESLRAESRRLADDAALAELAAIDAVSASFLGRA